MATRAHSQAWLLTAVNAFRGGIDVYSSHLGEIYPGRIIPERIGAALDLLREVRDTAALNKEFSRISLVIPIGLVEILDVVPPPMTELSIIDTEVAAIYAFSREYFATFAGGREEFRTTYVEPLPWGDEFAIEYICGRNQSDRARGWEFSRDVWFHAPLALWRR